ncbi:ATP-binding protein [Alicyclobacillus fodiniaquatilis]|uniref:ATP-binding protein n=1 Tax=Alicyclobacillus fodiniaquatilis TaxID=1661150 RepID=A0ABW4JEU3_9BACL
MAVLVYLWIIGLLAVSVFFIDWGKVLQYAYDRCVFLLCLSAWIWQVAIPFLKKHPFQPPLMHPGPYMKKWSGTFLHNPHYLIMTLGIAGIYIVFLMSKVFFPLGSLFQRLSQIQHKTVLRWKPATKTTSLPNYQSPRSTSSSNRNTGSPKTPKDWWSKWQEEDRQKRTGRMPQVPQTPTVADDESLRMNGKVGRQQLGQRYPIDKRAMERIIGMKEPLEAIRMAIEIPLKAPKVAQKYNYKGFTGMILHGPPGNGKTALARAVAQSLGMYFIAVQPSSLLGTLVGATEQHIRNAFLEAQENAPSILFFDEIDAIGKLRGMSTAGHLDTALNELLIALDGFESRKGVFVMAATNRLDIIDPALLRPGRFDKKIYVPNPDKDALAEMFWTWTRDLPLSDVIYPREIAQLVEGASGAEMKGWTDKLRELAVKKAYNREPEIIIRDEVINIIRKYPTANALTPIE